MHTKTRIGGIKMTTVRQILDMLEDFAPKQLAESWDNVGIMTGDHNQNVKCVLCALDVTEIVVREAIEKNAQLIIAHHPLIFTSVKNITQKTETGRAIRLAIKNDISVICMHTNADSTWGGVNDALANVLELSDIISMEAGDNALLGRVGNLKTSMTPKDFALYVKNKLGAGGVRFTNGGKNIKRVAVGGGACGKLMDYALAKDADAFVIGDCSYDLMQKAQSLGLTLVDAGHFPTENPVVKVFAQKVSEKFKDIQVLCSKTHKDCIEFV